MTVQGAKGQTWLASVAAWCFALPAGSQRRRRPRRRTQVYVGMGGRGAGSQAPQHSRRLRTFRGGVAGPHYSCSRSTERCAAAAFVSPTRQHCRELEKSVCSFPPSPCPLHHHITSKRVAFWYEPLAFPLTVYPLERFAEVAHRALVYLLYASSWDSGATHMGAA